jgi:hypothetical protein
MVLATGSGIDHGGHGGHGEDGDLSEREHLC